MNLTSEKQVAANRRNAAKSTGPKTTKGKQLARMNAMRHGLRAQQVLIPDEDSGDYELFREGAFRDLEPAGFLESQIAENIVGCLWRLRRCSRIEATLLGGGTHVMDRIERTSVDEFIKMLEAKDDPEHPSESQYFRRLMFERVQAYFDGIPREEWRHSLAAGEDLVEAYRDARDEERQSNPLTVRRQRI